MKKKLTAAAAILIAVPLTTAALAGTPLARKDFAYGLNISTPKQGTLYRIVLTEPVYKNAVKPDLGDLRVFNSEEDVVPHDLRMQPVEVIKETTKKSLTFFPIQKAAPGNADEGESVELSQDAAGNVTSVRFRGAVSRSSRTKKSYLVDLRGNPDSLRALEFKWKGAKDDSVVRLKIEGGYDLNDFNVPFPRSTLAKLSFQGEELVQNRIEFSPVRTFFLKITSEDDKDFQIQSLQGEFLVGTGSPNRTQQQPREATRGTAKLTGTLLPPEKEGETTSPARYQYDTEGRFPVDQLELKLPSNNTLFQVAISSSDKPDGKFEKRYSGTVYRITQEGKQVESPTIALPYVVSDRYWIVAIEGKDSTLGKKLPDLEISWIPHELLFLAQGNGPFQLAFGAGAVETGDFGFNSLIEDLKSANKGEAPVTTSAQLSSARREFGGKSKLAIPEPVKETPWKKYGLWAALAVAVLLLTYMATRVYRDLAHLKGDK